MVFSELSSCDFLAAEVSFANFSDDYVIIGSIIKPKEIQNAILSFWLASCVRDYFRGLHFLEWVKKNKN